MTHHQTLAITSDFKPETNSSEQQSFGIAAPPEVNPIPASEPDPEPIPSPEPAPEPDPEPSPDPELDPVPAPS